MFTGIITGQGHILDIHDAGDRHLTIGCDWDCAAIDLGASIACSGICLTVVARDAHSFRVAASSETMSVTTLGGWQKGDKINLERALRMGDELGGHIVSGHVDGIGEVVALEEDARSWRFRLRAPREIAKYIAHKGSITVDGTSLTVNIVEGAEFELNIVPHTMQHTVMGDYKVGTKVNLEVDLVARYLERLLLGDKAADQ